MGIVIFGIAVFSIYFIVIVGKSKKNSYDNDWLMNTLSKSDIKHKRVVLYGRDNILICTKACRRIYFIQPNQKKIVKINPIDVIDISIDMDVKEKNVKKIISLTPTYTRYSNVESVKFKVITERGTYILDYDGKEVIGIHTSQLPSSKLNTIEDKIDEMKVAKSVIEEYKIYFKEKNNC